MMVLNEYYFELSLIITWNLCQNIFNLFSVIFSFMLDIFIGSLIIVDCYWICEMIWHSFNMHFI